MIGLLLVSHGRLAQALLDTAVEIVGPFEAAEAIPVSRQDALEEVEQRLTSAIRRVDRGRGVLVLVDMFGGTAANVTLRLVGQLPIEVVTGVSLPMLLKLASTRRSALGLFELAKTLAHHGKENVTVASEMLKERERDA